MDYKKKIIESIEKIDDEKILRRIYLILAVIFQNRRQL